jgi:protocatechuate 3,4-dioxygenase beta subunit
MRGSTVAAAGGALLIAVGGVAWWLLAGGPAAPTGAPPAAEDAARPDAAPAGPEDAPASEAAAPAPVPRGVAAMGRLVRGRPPVPVRGQVTVTAPGAAPRTAASGADGRFLVEGIPPGVPVALAAVVEGLLPARYPRLLLQRSGVTDLGDIQVGEGRDVEVAVVDRADRPVAGAVVRIARTGIWRSSFDWVEVTLDPPPRPASEVEAATGPDGRATLRSVPPGSWSVTAEAKGYGTETTAVAVDETRETGEVRILLLPSHPLRGTVTRADGEPAAGVVVIASSATGSWFSDAGRVEATTDAAGAYALEGLREGANQVAVRTSADARSGVGTVRVPEVPVFDIRLAGEVTLRGRVLDAATSAPLEGARVTASLWDGSSGDASSLGRAVSAADGSWEVRGLQPGNFNGIAVRMEGYLQFPHAGAKQDRTVQRIEAGTVREEEARLRKGAAVAGKVVDAKGTPAAGARVVALSFALSRGVDTSAPAVVGADGSYRIENLDETATILQVQGEGFSQPDFPRDYWTALQQGTAPESCSLRMPAEGEATKDLVVVRGASVSGTVTDREGKPVRGLTVTASASKNSVGGGDGSTDEAGAFRLEGVAPGDGLVVSAWGPKGVHGTSEPFSLAEGGAAEGIRVTVAPGASLAGRVTRADGGALADCRLRLAAGAFDPQNPWNWQWQERQAKAHAVAADGSFRIEGLREGTYSLLAEAPGAASFRGEKIELAPGEAKEGVEVPLGAEAVLAGRVVLESGEPVAGARLAADEMARRQVMYGQGRGEVVAISGPGGEFRIGGRGEGSWVITAEAPGFPPESATVKSGTRDAVITLRAGGSITGFVVDESTGAPVPDLPVSANPMVWTAGGPQPKTATTGKDGSFAIRDLKAGEWNVVAGQSWGSQGEFVPKSVPNVRTGTADLRIAVGRGLAIEGTLVDEAGKPVQGVLGVQVLGTQADGTPDWPRQRWIQSEGDGTFRAPGLAPGTYSISVNPAYGGAGAAYAPATVRGVDAGTKGVTVVLRRGSPISGRVLDEEGKPWSRGGHLIVAASGEAAAGSQLNAPIQPDGSFTTPALDPAKTWDLLVSNTPGAAGAVARGVAAGAKDVVLRVEKGGTISGRVEDEAGNPVQKVHVVARAEGAVPGAPGSQAWAQTDASGTFAAKGLGEYRFRVTAGGWNSDWILSAAPETVAPGATDLVLRVRKGVSLSGRIVDDAGSALKPQGLLLIPEGTRDDDGSWAHIADDGSFTAKGLPPGKVRLRAYGGAGWKECGSFEAPAAGVVVTVPK